MPPDLEDHRRSKRRWWVAVVGIGLLSWLLWRLGPSEIAASLAETEVGLFALALIVYFPTLALRVWRWQILLKGMGIHYRFIPAYKSYIVGMTIGLFTPGRMGEVARVYSLRQDCGVSMVRALPSVLADRLFDFPLVFFTGAAALVSFSPLSGVWLWAALGGLFAAVAGGAVAAAHGPTMSRIALVLGTVGRRWRLGGRFEDVVMEVHRGFRQITAGTCAAAALLTLAAFILFNAECYLIAKSLGIAVGPIDTAYAVSLGTLIAMVPVSISGLGTRDATVVAYFSALGVPAAVALSFSLLWYVAFYLLTIILGGLIWWSK